MSTCTFCPNYRLFFMLFLQYVFAFEAGFEGIPFFPNHFKMIPIFSLESFHFYFDTTHPSCAAAERRPACAGTAAVCRAHPHKKTEQRRFSHSLFRLPKIPFIQIPLRSSLSFFPSTVPAVPPGRNHRQKRDRTGGCCILQLHCFRNPYGQAASQRNLDRLKKYFA